MRHRRFTVRPIAMLLLISAASLGGSVANATVTCAADHPGGGDWASLNGALDNSRNQSLEDTIGVAEVASLAPAWKFSPRDIPHNGNFQSTPVIAEGCVFMTNSSGHAYALNADTGELVWAERYEQTVTGVCCGGTMFAPAVANGVVYINVSHNPETATDTKGPYVLALDATDGSVLWRSDQVAFEPGSYTNSSAVYINSGDPDSTADDLIWIGISNPEQDLNQIGGFALVNAVTGDVVKRTRTVPIEQFEKGMGGGAIWSTAAIDEDLYGYAGTAQPSCWTCPESELVNAIIKFDVDSTRDTFGQIVDAHKGTWDSELRGDHIYYIDVDFAASPTLYDDVNGEPMVAELQKSGWVHAAHTRHMSRAWSTPVSPYGTATGNYSTTATDGLGTIFAHGTFPGQIVALDGTTGLIKWASPAPTLVGANPLTYANGVLWLAGGLGVLHAYDAATGLPLLARPMQLDTEGLCMNAGGGVAIARHTVYAVCGDGEVGLSSNDGEGGWIVAYRLPS